MTDDFTPIPFSRSLIGGKKTEKFEGRVSYDLKELARRKWSDDGFQSESEYIEFLVAVDVCGVDHVRSLIQQRYGRVFSLSDKRQTSEGSGQR
ncbi:hypothetical protein [Comamonas sp.]|uniref:hypothetical protein n=1 Tax=Comamonas sp. TaxID=34028 RepID=UPI00289AAA09|nr:hypothetical protein [Comamonas sp.]